MDRSISQLFISTPKARLLPDADCLVATGVQTAAIVAYYPPSKGKKFYLVQDLEDWIYSSDAVRDTWRLPMTKITVAKWLTKEIQAAGASDVAYVQNPIDTQTFCVTRNPEQRNPYHVGMQWSSRPAKRAGDGAAALEMAKEWEPAITATVFGSESRPKALPRWVHYVRGLHGDSLADLYNDCAMFLHTSASEGFGLPPAEAMSCGCAIVATRNLGVSEYLNQSNALLCPVGDVSALAVALLKIARDEGLRRNLVRGGVIAAESLSIARAAGEFEQVLSVKRGL